MDQIGQVKSRLARCFVIKQIKTSVAHPCSNESVERAHARLAEFIDATFEEIRGDMNCNFELFLCWIHAKSSPILKSYKRLWRWSGKQQKPMLVYPKKGVERDEKRVIRRKIEVFKVRDQIVVRTQAFKGKTNRTVPTWSNPVVAVTVSIL